MDARRRKSHLWVPTALAAALSAAAGAAQFTAPQLPVLQSAAPPQELVLVVPAPLVEAARRWIAAWRPLEAEGLPPTLNLQVRPACPEPKTTGPRPPGGTCSAPHPPLALVDLRGAPPPPGSVALAVPEPLLTERAALAPAVTLAAERPASLYRILHLIPAVSPPPPALASFLRWAGHPWGQAAWRRATGPALRLAFVGDVQLARGLRTMQTRYGPDYPFALVAERLAAADLAVANLESPLGSRGAPVPGKGIWFQAPGEAVEALVRSGIDAVTLANNHSLDYGPESFWETLAILHGAGIHTFGGGVNPEEARRPLLLEVEGLRLALLGYSQFADLIFTPGGLPFAAAPGRPGLAPLHPAEAMADVRAARRQADLVVVYLHWGEEYRSSPTPEQVRLGRALIDAGADLVIGSHPHVLQGLEVYGRGVIAYSLGNFVMDQTEELHPAAVESLILEAVVTRSGVQRVEVVPAALTGFRPRL
ncbi:MAG: CapA family protein, partial [Bacillota bacterium]|nr:CapA family protein [Bacillota bacterium]